MPKITIFISEIFVIPAKAGTHGATSTCGWVGSRLRGNDGTEMMNLLFGLASQQNLRHLDHALFGGAAFGGEAHGDGDKPVARCHRDRRPTMGGVQKGLPLMEGRAVMVAGVERRRVDRSVADCPFEKAQVAPEGPDQHDRRPFDPRYHCVK